MLNLDTAILAIIVAAAKEAAAQYPRWLNAIERAARELETNAWIERGDHGLVIASPSGNVYTANGACQCDAYSFGNACWHRAAARLVRRYDEYVAAPQAAPAAPQAAPAPRVDRSAEIRRAAYLEAQRQINELFA